MQAFDGKYPGVASGAQAGPLVMANRIDQISHACKTGEFAAPTRTGYLTGCQIMWQKLSVLHDGTYVPCHQLSHISLGQVGKNTLREVWQNSQGLQRLRGRSNIPLESIPHCKGCRYQQYCTGGCPGLAYAIAGEVDTINPLDCYRAYVEEDPVYAY
jgi:radical SAM protein with 4Fe4S-binding SPASM domain